MKKLNIYTVSFMGSQGYYYVGASSIDAALKLAIFNELQNQKGNDTINSIEFYAPIFIEDGEDN